METIKHQRLIIGTRINSQDGANGATIVRRYKGSPIHFDVVLDTGDRLRFVTIVDIRAAGLTHAGPFEIK